MKKIAIITGASSGMGLDFAKEIDKKNLDEIWIIARRKELLEKLASELKTECKIFDIDLTNSERNKLIEEELKKGGVEIQYLINNAGFGLIGEFSELDLNKQLNMIDLNIRALVQITHFSIKYMAKGGEIIQVASTAGFLPMKNFAIYAATKAFVVNFTNALALELKPKNIHAIAICPGPVKTEFFDVATSGKVPPFVYESIDVVKKALKDSKKKKLNSIYGILMKVVMTFAHFTPRRIKVSLGSKGM
jgi:hypothetical protein